MKTVPALQPQSLTDASLVASLLLLGIRVIAGLRKDFDTGEYFFDDEKREKEFDLIIGTAAYLAGTGNPRIEMDYVHALLDAPEGSATVDGFDDKLRETLLRLGELGRDYTNILIEESDNG